MKSATALAGTAEGDAKIFDLANEVGRLVAVADEIQETRIWPFEEEFQDRIHARGVSNRSLEDAFEFSRRCGREAAIGEQQVVDAESDRVFRLMTGIPATTQAARAAKVSAFLLHVGRGKWRGPAIDLDWDIDMARSLSQEFAGLSAEEIANA